jgi:DNA repair ATPase RecN
MIRTPIFSGVPLQRDDDEERIARIDAMCEEYRVKHEDLIAHVESVRARPRQLKAHADGLLRKGRTKVATTGPFPVNDRK